MQRQTEMENTMRMAHLEFMSSLEKALDLLEKDIDEAAAMSSLCTDEWCNATEGVIDELHKCIYSISEPRWLTKEDTQGIRRLRERVKGLYARYQSIRP